MISNVTRFIDLNNQKFRVRPKPREDELLSSWLVRVARAHLTHTTSFTNMHFKEYKSNIIWQRDLDIWCPDELIERMRDNYISKLKYTYHDDADSLIKMLNEMPLNHFYALFKINEGGVFDFDIYDSEQSIKSFGSVSTDGMPMDDLLSAMMTEVESYNQGNYDMDFANLIN